MASTSAKQPPAKSGISVGRIVLWGFIAVLAGTTLAEFLSQQSYRSAWTAVEDKMDEGSGMKRIKKSDIEQVLAGRTPKLVESFEGRSKAPGAKKMAVYSWFTANPTSSRSIFVYYNENDEVVQHSQIEYIADTETKPVVVKEGEGPSLVPMSAGMANMTDEERKGMSGGYDNLMPEELRERRKKEIEAEKAKEAEAAKAKEEAAGSDAKEPAAATTDEKPAADAGDAKPAEEKPAEEKPAPDAASEAKPE